MDVNDRIEKMLIRYLGDKHGIVAISAYLGDTEGGGYGGCDTCGYGSTEMSFEIFYRAKIDPNRTYHIDVDGDPLGFFPTLLGYDEDDM